MRFTTTLSIFAFAALAVLALADPALAAAHADAGHGGGHGEAKGPLAFTGIERWDLGVYTLIVFGLLIAILSVLAWPNIKAGLEKRETNIRGALDEARKDREEAKAALAQAKTQLDETALKVKAMLDEARKDADALRSEQRDVGVKEAQAERDRAKRELALEKDALVKEIYDQAVKLAALMSEKALRRSVSAEDHKRLLDESIAELKDGTNKA